MNVYAMTDLVINPISRGHKLDGSEASRKGPFLHDSRRALSKVDLGFLKDRIRPMNSIPPVVNKAW
jgi:hypothetical protein